jgi:hypothetical protein
LLTVVGHSNVGYDRTVITATYMKVNTRAGLSVGNSGTTSWNLEDLDVFLREAAVKPDILCTGIYILRHLIT